MSDTTSSPAVMQWYPRLTLISNIRRDIDKRMSAFRTPDPSESSPVANMKRDIRQRVEQSLPGLKQDSAPPGEENSLNCLI